MTLEAPAQTIDYGVDTTHAQTATQTRRDIATAPSFNHGESQDLDVAARSRGRQGLLAPTYQNASQLAMETALFRARRGILDKCNRIAVRRVRRRGKGGPGAAFERRLGTKVIDRDRLGHAAQIRRNLVFGATTTPAQPPPPMVEQAAEDVLHQVFTVVEVQILGRAVQSTKNASLHGPSEAAYKLAPRVFVSHF